ncbi:MAG: diguanylate cyclase domain-containing protein [Myxococcota bacterium]
MGQKDDQDTLLPAPEPGSRRLATDSSVRIDSSHPAIAPGEALQLVRFSKRDQTLMITGLTPHGRRLTFEQRQDREGWYVVVAGRRRRPTRRELALVVASITQEMEAALGAERDDDDVRSAYRLAASSDQPGLPGRGLQAYRDLLLDEAASYIAGQVERLAVVAVEYQAFKRFALRHGHRIGQAFVRALGERLQYLYRNEERVHVCHKSGKSFRLIVMDRSAAEVQELAERIPSEETRRWLVRRVWGDEPRTHPDEVHLYLGIAMARPAERTSATYETLAQTLNDDAYRAAKLGQLQGHTSLQAAKVDYRSTIRLWVRNSEDELEALASQMDDGPADVMSETVDYLNELVPADLDGMAVDGDVEALINKAIARDGFWQGSIAMRIAGDELLRRFLQEEVDSGSVAGFDVGDEFYGLTLEDGALVFAWGDINSAGATRTRAGLARIRQAVGWGRKDGRGIVGLFVQALRNLEGDPRPVEERVRSAAQDAFDEIRSDPVFRVNDAVDIAEFLVAADDGAVRNEHLEDGSTLILNLPGSRSVDLDRKLVRVVERKSNFIVRLNIEGAEHLAAVSNGPAGMDLKLRIRGAVPSASVCMIRMSRRELKDVLAIIREDNGLTEDEALDIVGFLRHIADLLLAEQVKAPGKIRIALGEEYDPKRFVRTYSLEEVREHHPGLFYEAVHQELLHETTLNLDRNLVDIVARTMLSRSRPEMGS